MKESKEPVWQRRWFLWGGLVFGAIIWATDMTIAYLIVPWACEHENRVALLSLSIVALLVLAPLGWLYWKATRYFSSDEAEERSSDRFLAITSLMLTAVFVIATVAGAIPRIVLSPCA